MCLSFSPKFPFSTILRCAGFLQPSKSVRESAARVAERYAMREPTGAEAISVAGGWKEPVEPERQPPPAASSTESDGLGGRRRKLLTRGPTQTFMAMESLLQKDDREADLLCLCLSSAASAVSGPGSSSSMVSCSAESEILASTGNFGDSLVAIGTDAATAASATQGITMPSLMVSISSISVSDVGSVQELSLA
eukprot:COSAG05_NODE_2767_length_2665_cov_2.778254_1_plen_193_part_10